MTKPTAQSLVRLLAGSVLVIFCIALMTSFMTPAAAQAVSASGPKIWLQQNQPLAVQHVPAGQGAAAANLAGLGKAQPVSMAAADLDSDGFQDLVVGYSSGAAGYIAVHRGNIDAFAPQSEESFQAIGRGEFPSPFVLAAQTFSVPVSPDFMALGNFAGTRNQDLVIASRGGTALYVFPSDGKGNFGNPQTLNLAAAVTSLAAGEFGNSRASTLVVGTSGPGKSFQVTLYTWTAQGLTALASYPLAGPAANILFGQVGDPGPDAAFLSAGQIEILHSSSMQLETVTLPVSARAFALGSFIFDRYPGLQIALLAANGSVEIAVHSHFDPRPYSAQEQMLVRQANLHHRPNPLLQPVTSTGWKVAESFASVGAVNTGHDPVFFRTRVSNHGADDIMWLDAGSGQMAVISHPDTLPGVSTFVPGQVSLRPYSGAPVKALSMRLNVDGRPGVVAIHSAEIAPSLTLPIPDPTFTVNTTSDGVFPGSCAAATPNQCTLREAILEANGDNIIVPAGTYQLTIGRGPTQDYSGNTGALYVNNSATIVGDPSGTIIAWGTPNCGGATPCTVDLVMAVNQDIPSPAVPNFTTATASLSNLTIQGGVNNGTIPVGDGFGGGMEFDTGLNGTATLTLTNVTVTNNSTTDGDGGGLAIFNTNDGAGAATLINSIVSNNTPNESSTGGSGLGGGIYLGQPGSVVLNNTQVISNNATQTNSPKGQGGGLWLGGQTGITLVTTSAIHGGSISGNAATGEGGGIYSTQGITIDSGTLISNNISGVAGGGIWYNAPSPYTASLSKVTITGNQANGASPDGVGGGIRVDSEPGNSLALSFSRLAGNKASTAGTNLSESAGTVTAPNNWWGTNAAGSTISAAGGISFDPFIVLTHTSNPHPIRINQSTALTADMSADNHGDGTALNGNLDEITGLPLTIDQAVLGSIPGAPVSTILGPGNFTLGATFNAGGASGFGDAVATLNPSVENYQVHVNTNAIISATETGGTATIVTAGVHGFTTSDFVTISGMTGAGCAGYNGGPFAIINPTPTTFTYTAPPGLNSCNGAANSTASIGLAILQPPSITKSFSPKTITTTNFSAGSFSTITFSITNPNVVPINGSFTDGLPSIGGAHPGSLVVASTPSVTNTCGGAVTATAGSSSISFSNNSVPVGTCNITVNVSSGVDDNYSNSVTIDSTDAGNGNTSTDSLTVIDPPQASKSFTPNTIVFGATSTLTIGAANPNQNQALSNITFTDSLPAGVIVATPGNPTTGCSGAVTAPDGSSSVHLASSSLPSGASCNVTVTVQGTTAVVANNSVQETDGTAGTGAAATATLTVNKADTSMLVTSSTNPSTFGQPVTFTATVSAVPPGTGIPTGTVTFLDGGTPIASCSGQGTLTAGIGTCTTSALLAGSHTITANYSADPNFNGSTGSLTGNPQIVNHAGTTTTVTSSLNPSGFGQPVTFSALVSAVAPGAGTPTGTVVFSDNGSAIITCGIAGAVPLSGGVAACATTTLTPGNHTITTIYGGDSNFLGSPGLLNTNPQVVNQASTTITVTVTPPSGTITLGDTLFVTATVNPPGSGTPTGLVTFFDGSTPLGSAPLNKNNPDQASFSTSLLSVGSHSLTAIYSGDTDFTGSPLSTPVSVTANLRSSTTSVALNPTTVGAGQASAITVTVTDSGATPPGTPDVFTSTGAPVAGRTGFTSTLVGDGLVLVAGGQDANNNVLQSAEAYVAALGTFSAGGLLNTARTGAVAVLLENGKVLIAGGSSDGTANGALNSAELFDPNTGKFALTSHAMTAARLGATATLLSNGNVLLAGGQNSGGALNTAELYDADTDTFTATGNLNTARTGASATLLASGKVLLAGGSGNGGVSGALNSAEVFDPAGNGGAGAFTSVAGANPTLTTGRWQPEAALLLSGKVLIAGGQNSGGVLTSADLYDPVADSFTATAHPMNEARANGSAVALPNGMVLLPGGTTSTTVDVYDAEGDRFDTTGALLHSDDGLVATQLNNGQVLVVGLTVPIPANPPNPAIPALSDAELYSPSFNALGTIGFSSSEPTDVFGAACVLTPSTSTASTCTSTVTPIQVATSPHTITGTYAADAVHSGSSNTASLTVIPTAPPTIAKAFSAQNVAQNSTVNVSFTIVNPNPASTLTGISFTDSLAAGLVVATPNNLNSNCGGTFTAVAGSSSLSLTGGSLAPPGPPPFARRTASRLSPTAGQCVITVDLLVTGTGTLSNTTGPISANESGPGSPSNTASLNVILAPTANKAFGAATIPLNGTTSLTFNIANPNAATGLINISVADALPSGLLVANPNGLTGSCVASSVISATAGGNSITLSALNLGGSGSCSFSVNVTGTSGGTKNNTTGAISALFDDGTGVLHPITGGTASASVVVVLPPVISKAFAPSAIAPNGVSSLTFTITNPAVNTVAEAGVAFTDTLPANLVVATPNGATGICNSGTLTAVAGSGSINLVGGSIPVGSSCVVSVNVASSVIGSYTNTTGAVSSTNGGTGNTASATLTVANASLAITKTHTGNFPRGSSGNNYTITVSASASAGPTVGTVTVTDTLPNVPNTLVPTAMTGTGWTCTLATLTCTRSDSLAAGATYPAITLTVNVPQNIQANVTNSATVSGGGDANSHTANDPTHVGPPIVITSTDSGSFTVSAGNPAIFHFQVDTTGVTPLPNVVTFSCDGLPAGATCAFSQFGASQAVLPLTLVISTTGPGGGSTAAIRKISPMYAALMFPVMGLIGISLAGRKGKRTRVRLGLILMGLLLLAALAGCGGGGSGITATPHGQSTVTVTGTAQSAQGPVSGSTTVSLTVQ